jgi:hypothetical protein
VVMIFNLDRSTNDQSPKWLIINERPLVNLQARAVLKGMNLSGITT